MRLALTRQLDKATLRDTLVDALPLKQRPFKGTQAYELYVTALWDYLTTASEYRQDKLPALWHVKGNFEHMCNGLNLAQEETKRHEQYQGSHEQK